MEQLPYYTIVPGEVAPSDTYSWNDIAHNLDRSSEYDLKNFPKVFRSLWYL